MGEVGDEKASWLSEKNRSYLKQIDQIILAVMSPNTLRLRNNNNVTIFSFGVFESEFKANNNSHNIISFFMGIIITVQIR